MNQHLFFTSSRAEVLTTVYGRLECEERVGVVPEVSMASWWIG